MAKKVDTRVEGRGLVYDYYDTTMVEQAKAPKARYKEEFKVGKPKTISKPGEVTYYGEEFKSQAQELSDKRNAAYVRRQSNEYIRTGTAAPADKVSDALAGINTGKLRTEGYTEATTAARRAEKTRALETMKRQMEGFATNTGGNLRMAAKRTQSLANFMRPTKSDEELS